MRILSIFAATAAVGAIATPALAQNPYPYPYPQQQGYAYPNQGYGQANQGGIAGIIGQLLGNRHAPNDRHAVTQCATAAQAQAARQYRPAGYDAYGRPPYGNAYGYQGQGYGHSMARVTAITSVEQRRGGLRVTGTMDSGMATAYGHPAYGQPGYGNQAMGDLQFRCSVDYRGMVTNLKVSRNNQYRSSQYRRGW